MKSFNGQLDEWGAVTVAVYRRGKFKIICKTFNEMYFMTFHNGRYASVTRYTENKDEANEWMLKQIQEGFRRIKEV